MKLLIMQFPTASYYASSYVEIFSLASCSVHLTSPVCGLRSLSGSVFHTHRETQIYNFVYSNICLV